MVSFQCRGAQRLECEIWISTVCFSVLGASLTALGRSFNFSDFGFLVCKAGAMTVPIASGCSDHQMRKPCQVLRKLSYCILQMFSI